LSFRAAVRPCEPSGVRQGLLTWGSQVSLEQMQPGVALRWRSERHLPCKFTPTRTRERTDMADKKRQTRQVETMEYLQTVVRRTLVAAGKRVGDADEPEFEELLKMYAVLDDAVQAAVDGQRARGVSWAAIGAAAGITRQAATKKWGK
jgi:hypothetical protein